MDDGYQSEEAGLPVDCLARLVTNDVGCDMVDNANEVGNCCHDPVDVGDYQVHLPVEHVE